MSTELDSLDGLNMDQIIEYLKKNHGLEVDDGDMSATFSGPFLSTSASARLFGCTYHTFCFSYPELLLKAGVKRFTAGRHKYYELGSMLDILNKSIEKDSSVPELCRAMAKESEANHGRHG